MTRVTRTIGATLSVVALGLAAALTQSDAHRLLELASHLRPTVACGLWALGLGLAGTALRLATPSLLISAVIVGWPSLSLSWGRPAPAPDRAPLDLATINLQVSTGSYQRLPQTLAEAGWPDVVFLCEVSNAAQDVLAGLRERYPHQLRWPTADPWVEPVIGRVFLSARPFRSTLVHTSQPVLEIEIDHDGGRVALVSAHALRPWTESSIAGRNRTLDYLAERATADTDLVVIGDLNITEGSSRFQQLLERGELRDTRRGFGRQPSFAAKVPYHTLRTRIAQALMPPLPLDHVLVRGDLDCARRWVGPDIGSDHRPVFARLVRRGAGDLEPPR